MEWQRGIKAQGPFSEESKAQIWTEGVREARKTVQHSCIGRHLAWDYALLCLNSASTEISESMNRAESVHAA